MAPCACISISLSALFIHTTTQYQLTSHVHAFWVVQLLRGSRAFFMTLCVLKITFYGFFPLSNWNCIFLKIELLSYVSVWVLYGFNDVHEYFFEMNLSWQKLDDDEIYSVWSETKNLNPIDDFSKLLLRHIISERENKKRFLPLPSGCVIVKNKIKNKNCWASNWDGEKNEKNLKLNEKRNKSSVIASKCCVTSIYDYPI